MLKAHKRRWAFWGLAVFFYLYEYFLRVSPSVMVPELMSSFNIQAVAVGALASFYLYAYAFMQVPVGMMMDRLGARKLLSVASLICALGCLCYGLASTYWLVALGRILMGAGSAFSFLGVVYICSHWFEKNRIATLVSIATSFGMIGAIGADGPLALLVLKYGWRLPIIVLGLIGFALAWVMFIVLKEDEDCAIEQKNAEGRERVNVLKNLRVVASNIHSWLIGIGSFLIYSTTSAFAALWGVPFLQSAYKMSKGHASFAISLIFLGWIVGGPLIGKISDHIKQRRNIIIFCSVLGAIFTSILIYISALMPMILYSLLFLIGVVSSGETLVYCLAIEINPQRAKGVASAFINFILFLGAGFVPILVGLFLESNWQGNSANGIPIYSPMDYKGALTIFPVSFVLSAIIFSFVRKSPLALTEKEPGPN